MPAVPVVPADRTRSHVGAVPLGDFDVDVQKLAFELRDRIDGEVRFDPGGRHLYSTMRPTSGSVPLGVVVPPTVEDVETTLELCRRYGVPVTGRGAGRVSPARRATSPSSSTTRSTSARSRMSIP